MGDPLSYIDKLDFNTGNHNEVHEIVDHFPVSGTKTIKLCRCWQSRKFPYCDDAHKLLISSGDPVGPFVAKISSGEASDKLKNSALQKTRISQRTGYIGATAIVIAMLGTYSLVSWEEIQSKRKEYMCDNKRNLVNGF